LDAEFFFQPSEPPADDGLGNAKPVRGRRYALRRGYFNECTQVFYFQNDSPFLISRHSVTRNGSTGPLAILAMSAAASQHVASASLQQQTAEGFHEISQWPFFTSSP
jgi:hypothetical protein